MKKMYVVFGFMLCMALMMGCTKQASEKNEETPKVSFEQLVTDVKEQIATDLKASGVMEDMLVDGELLNYFEIDLTASEESDPAINIFLEKMKLNKAEIVNGKVIAAMMNVNADEIILLEAKDKEHVESLKTALETEFQAQKQTWERYLPDQYEKVEKNIIKTSGNFLLYVTYSEPENIEKVFDGSMK